MHIERILLRDVGPFDDVTIEFPKGKNPDLADVYLLTGPNGTGKSTVLYALAAVIGGNKLWEGLGHDFLTARMRSENAAVAFSADGEIFAISGSVPRLPWIRQLRSGGTFGKSKFYLWQSVPDHQYSDWALNEKQFSLGWAVFAYAGVRSVSDAKVTSLEEPTDSPLLNSLSFVNTSDTNKFAQWITNRNFRRLKARESGNNERAEQLARSIHDIEKTIGDIVGDDRFCFVFVDEDDDVRVRWNGVVIHLDLMPDGLKSITSWITDLLMRLERIPWMEDVPVLQRHFLLLLDEVDIHLHPAWQRKVLPFVQKVFPNAQIIASTHSPFVVASVDDAHIITLGLQGSSSIEMDSGRPPQIGVSYPAVARSIFGIESEFDVDTEDKLKQFHAARQRLLTGDIEAQVEAQAEVDRLANLLAGRSEELREIIALERNQLRRQLAKRATP